MNKLITGFNSTEHGFVPKKSLFTQLTSYLEEILAAVDSGNNTVASYFDLFRDFDSFPHSKLITKLSKFSLNQDFVNFFHLISLTSINVCQKEKKPKEVNNFSKNSSE